MAVLGYPDINLRYTGLSWPNCGTPQDITSKLVRDRHFMMAHRHRISLIDSETSGCSVWKNDAPRPEWLPRLDGSLFTAATGYEGPGEGIGNGVYSIGNYGSWWWKGQGQAAMWARTDGWVNWFEANSPTTERFLYLIDESTNYAQTEQWAAPCTKACMPATCTAAAGALTRAGSAAHAGPLAGARFVHRQQPRPRRPRRSPRIPT